VRPPLVALVDDVEVRVERESRRVRIGAVERGGRADELTARRLFARVAGRRAQRVQVVLVELGVEPERARRLLKFLMTKECGLGPIPVAQARVGWVVDESEGGRRYGLFVEAERPQA
jgi:hypothetical protein